MNSSNALDVDGVTRFAPVTEVEVSRQEVIAELKFRDLYGGAS